MSDRKLGLTGAIAIGLGGMIGGGVFAVLGVVVTIAGPASWIAFTAASLISMTAAYSYIKLNQLQDDVSDKGGSVTHLEQYLDSDRLILDRSTIAGMVGWTLLFGYVGAMAMYAFAFGTFAIQLIPSGVQQAVPLPLRPLLSVAAIGLFVLFNAVGARATGTSEELLVGLKLLILVGVSGWGLYFGWRSPSYQLAFGFDRLTSAGLVTATAISFVSFQGWQLLVYDYESIKEPDSNIPTAIYVSIVAAIIVDSMVAILVVNLAPTEIIRTHPEIAVARAVEPFLGEIGFVFVALAALFSTGSAINGTLFSAGHFAKGMLRDDLLPDRLGRASAEGAPIRTVVVLGTAAAAFSALGSLEGITSFGSLAFLVVFGSMSYLAFRKRGTDAINPVVPALGIAGTGLFFPLLLWHLWTAQRGVFWTVLGLTLAVAAIELLYFERETIADGITESESNVPGVDDEL